MVKRGIGAVVLAIIAALLLGYLLKDKGQERQDVVEMSLPGTTDTKIDLSDASENAGTVVADGATDLANGADATGAKVVAAATGAGVAMTAAAGNAANSTGNAVANAGNAANQQLASNSNVKPGFSIRPAGANEHRDIVDLNGKNASNKSTDEKTSKPANKQKASGNGAVVASASGNAQKDTYRPRLIKERKKTKIVASSRGSNNQTAANRSSTTTKVVSSSKKAKAKSKAASANTSAAKVGGYAIQLIATSSQSRAKKLKNTMKSEGYFSYITRTKRNGKVLYRVRVGVKGNRNSAIAFQQKMKRRYKKNFFVQNSLIVSN